MSQLAVTLFNFREFCKTESDLDRTLDKVCDIGYEVVQVSAVPLAPEIIRKQLDSHRLSCCAVHEKLDVILGDANALADKLDILGCDYVALGAPPKDQRTAEGITDIVRKMDAQGAILKTRGKQLAYHNHQFEFKRMGTDKIIFRRIWELTSPENVFSELDVYWVTRGGGNPVAWIKELGNRISVIHFKDFALLDETGEPVFCEVGEGNLDWPGIIQACREIGVTYYSVEQDKPYLDRDIFESARISFNNLKRFGLN